MSTRRSHRSITISLALFAATFAAAADTLTAKMTDAEPPTEIAQELRDTLDAKALQLSGPDGIVIEFWFRKELPLRSKPSTSEESIDALPEVSFIGAARYAKEMRDFRDDAIDPGVYTLRAGIQLNDGNHLGTSPTNTFMVLVPAKHDKSLKGIETPKKLHDTSRAENAADHPWVLNLQPVPADKAAGDFPMTGEAGDGWKLVYLKLPGTVEGPGEKADVTFGMVYEGHGKL